MLLAAVGVVIGHVLQLRAAVASAKGRAVGLRFKAELNMLGVRLWEGLCTVTRLLQHVQLIKILDGQECQPLILTDIWRQALNKLSCLLAKQHSAPSAQTGPLRYARGVPACDIVGHACFVGMPLYVTLYREDAAICCRKIKPTASMSAPALGTQPSAFTQHSLPRIVSACKVRPAHSATDHLGCSRLER